MTKFRIQAVLVSLLAVALGACASSPAATSGGGPAAAPAPTTQQQPADDNTILVTVNYNMPDQGPMTLYLEPTGGIQQPLGKINPNETKTYTFKVSNTRQVKVIARSDIGAGDKSSQAITVPTGQGVTWDMALNRMRLVRR